MPVAYTLTLTIPGNPKLDAIHKLDRFGSWLFSVEAANNLAGNLAGADADPRDVIRFDATAGVYTPSSCGSGPSASRRGSTSTPSTWTAATASP